MTGEGREAGTGGDRFLCFFLGYFIYLVLNLQREADE